jgi:hypothetical protein
MLHTSPAGRLGLQETRALTKKCRLEMEDSSGSFRPKYWLSRNDFVGALLCGVGWARVVFQLLSPFMTYDLF